MFFFFFLAQDFICSPFIYAKPAVFVGFKKLGLWNRFASGVADCRVQEAAGSDLALWVCVHARERVSPPPPVFWRGRKFYLFVHSISMAAQLN